MWAIDTLGSNRFASLPTYGTAVEVAIAGGRCSILNLSNPGLNFCSCPLVIARRYIHKTAELLSRYRGCKGPFATGSRGNGNVNPHAHSARIQREFLIY